MPSLVTIHPGDQVKWTWASSGHSTTSVNGIWNSGIRSQGATFTHTFNSAGTFRYICTQHIYLPPREFGQVIVTSATPTPTPPPGTTFNGDGQPDYLLFNPTTRQTAIWYLNNNVLMGHAFGPTLWSGWSLAGVADFNSDGKPDYLLYNPTTRQTAMWYLDNDVLTGHAFGPTLWSGWSLAGVADFNSDGKPDYLLYNSTTRQTAMWYLNNDVLIGHAYGPTLWSGWSVVAP